MKTPLGTEVDLGPGHIVLDGVPAPAKGAQQPPLFSAHVYCGHGRPSQLPLSSYTSTEAMCPKVHFHKVCLLVKNVGVAACTVTRTTVTQDNNTFGVHPIYT